MPWPDCTVVSVYVVAATGEEVSFEYDPGVVPRYSLRVATLITVMTIVQGANLYVEQKIAKDVQCTITVEIAYRRSSCS